MTQPLKERLVAVRSIGVRQGKPWNPDGPEALARIEAHERLRDAYDDLRSAWSFRQASALHADNEKYRFACEAFDSAFDRADAARSALNEGG